jgi:hypothetical protein
VDTAGRCVYLCRAARWGKVLDAVLRAASDANIEFVDLKIINLQPRASKAQRYQVKHVRNLITRYRLGRE